MSQGSRNPAIALLKDALQSSAPVLPTFQSQPQVNPQIAPSNAATQLSTATACSLSSALDAHPRRQRRRSRRSWLSRFWTRQRSVALRLKPTPDADSTAQDWHPLPEPPPLTPEQQQAKLQAKLLERRQRQARSRLWAVTWGLGILVLGSMGGIAYSLLTQLPPATNCQEMSPLASDGERLHCAQMAARSGHLDDLIAGIQLIQDWKPSHPMYRKAQVSMNEWSAALLNRASAILQERGLEPAVEIASHIPAGSPLYEEAQDRIRNWEQQWQQGEEIYSRAIAALSQQAWGIATDQVKALGQLSSPYWQQERSNELSLRILQEQDAHKRLQTATSQVTDDPDQLAQALKTLQEISPETLVWERAQVVAQQWSDDLVAAAMQSLAAGNQDQAIAWVQSVPLDWVDNPVAVDLIRLSQAQQLADLNPSHWRTNPLGIWRLMEAIAAAAEIAPESQFYGDAQAAIAQWQNELDDLSQLQMAQWIASLGNRYAFELAMVQAESIEPGRPRRVQAQTLMAHWRRETQRILDRPVLAQAVAIADAGTLESLQTAIDQARSIGSDRALYPQVEQAINQWTQQIQAIEDGPVLEAARQLAAEEKWSDAIAKADTIAAGRALYDIAQRDVTEWRSKLQIEQNRQRLAEARTLAGRLRLTQAIQVASQIQPRQPLYSEAQAAIGQWIEERDAIRARQEAQQPNDSDAGSETLPAPTGDSSSGRYEGYFDPQYDEDP